MLRNFFLSKYQKKINKLSPKVNVVLGKEVPTPSAKDIFDFSRIVSEVNSFEQGLLKREDSFFKEKTGEFKEMVSKKIKGCSPEGFLITVNTILDEILPFYFAMVRESARRTIGLRHFDVQILGGIILHKNKIAEMTTGEGKTLVATLAAGLNSLVGDGVHIITVNDYLARRDWEWMLPVYRFLGLSCGVIQQDTDKNSRRNAYACNITYGTNNEFGFDYLRDNMTISLEGMAQRGHFYAIVDEVDSILVDEARTPLIISGPAEVSVEKYYLADKVIRQLNIKKVISVHDTKEGISVIKDLDGSELRIERDQLEDKWEMIVEEKSHNTYLTQKGEKKCESLLGINSIAEDTPDEISNYWIHYVNNSGKAHNLFHVDKDYIVKDGNVIIVDEFTGRLMPGRRWSEGIHQAVEAKERLKIQQESQTLATVTLQNYFRMYHKLAGMTGTAYTEANEFRHIYNLDVVCAPTNKTLKRTNFPDRIYKTKRAKFKAIIDEIQELYAVKKPILVGTSSIDDSEEISFMLKKKGIVHNVLNAKYHEREAHIVAQAGRLGQVTIATNMAGRGTDIILGGNIDYFIKEVLSRNNISVSDEEYINEYKNVYQKYKDKFENEHDQVVRLGGLHIIGAQRHEARRIDNQLRGRSGRQGDPGSARFYISLEDDLMRLFGSDRIYLLMDKLGFPEDDPIEHGLVTHSIAVAQKKVEAHNFEIRKNLLQFDDVMNRQRETIYARRREVLEKQSIKDDIFDIIDEVVSRNVNTYCVEEYNLGAFIHWLKLTFDADVAMGEIENLKEKEIELPIKEKLKAIYIAKEKSFGEEHLRMMEKMVSLSVIDSKWKEHLLVIDSLKEGISLRGYAQVDPVVEYQKESYLAFSEMMNSIDESVIELVFKTKITPQQEIKSVFSETPQNLVHSQYSSLGTEAKNEEKKPVLSPGNTKKVGRNEPCPCGSGKKYKKCCGR